MLDVMNYVGSQCGSIIPEERPVAQQLLSVALELLLLGGSVVPAHVVDQLGGFAGVSEAYALRRKGLEEEQAEWFSVISRPTEALLSVLTKRGFLESSQESEREVVTMASDAKTTLECLRRFFDPATQRGMDDALRRCTNRNQQTRRPFNVTARLNSPRSPRQGSKAAALNEGELDLSAIPARPELGAARSSPRRAPAPLEALDAPWAAAGDILPGTPTTQTVMTAALRTAVATNASSGRTSATSYRNAPLPLTRGSVRSPAGRGTRARSNSPAMLTGGQSEPTRGVRRAGSLGRIQRLPGI